MSSQFLPAGPDTTTAPAAEPARRSWLKRLGALLGGAALATPALARPASPENILDADTFVGEIMLFAGNFAPRGYALCNGQLLSIQQNTALFSLLGTFYGGDGRTNFALPNLQGTTPIGQFQGPGLTARTIGEQVGNESTTLLISELPSHLHGAQVLAVAGTSSSPGGNVPAVATTAANASGEAVSVLHRAAAPNALAGATTLGVAGSSLPIGLQSPYLVLNYCIALQGIYPSRS
ncbi:phage tail protein [Hymenobacter terricola]|uniref:phage tail protein n=1 Tax=Hymenobacter terricola TaxID=2819236 RepID=UPI001CF5F278|nr:tail fiber protein [Hymenobacter terricola]